MKLEKLKRKLLSFFTKKFILKGMSPGLAQSNAEFMVDKLESEDMLDDLNKYVSEKPKANHEGSKEKNDVAAPSSGAGS